MKKPPQCFNRALLPALLLTLGSCVDQISTDLPAPPKRLVVNSILTPDSVFRVQVSRVTSTTDASSRLLSSAQVSLLTAGGSTEVLRSQGNGLYASTNQPASSTAYTLTVQANDYPTVSATDTVPAVVPIREAWYSFPTGTDRNHELLGTVVVRFDDPAATENFYEISVYQQSYRAAQQSNGLTLDARGNAAIVAEDESELNPKSLVFSDKLFNGRSFELRASFLTGGYSSSSTNGQPPVLTITADINLVLRSVSRAYYQYRKSWTRHLYNQGVKDEGYGYDLTQLLFLGDPTAMYSNVGGGYGVVAGYAKQSLILPLR
ncbi:DUF4249 domain-containing protein [Hymenobacter terricola]|uniref:DUF4249 domain-containing protein n=1 Tax=Hymenobacter terricola TaxID=2819236 RepID=UPI001B30579F|nr:DUF4249 domain-containing protein [Hymenobacter terricola]